MSDAEYTQQQPQNNQPEKPKKDRSFLKAMGGGALGAVIVAVVLGLVLAFTPLGSALRGSDVVDNGDGTYTITTTGEDVSVAEAVSAKCLPSTVTIYVYEASSNWSQYFGYGSSSSSSSSPSAMGSGVVVQSDSKGSYILTNYHVIEDSSRVTIDVDNKTYDAQIIGSDTSVDLAVVYIECPNMTVMEWGDSDSVTVGEWVMAIGSPMGYEGTCTTGIVSAEPRNDNVSDGNNTYYQTGVIQTDAAINPGNSGGALVDAEGKLIGIVEYLASYSSANAGLGFAIPQSTAQAVAESLIAGETPSHAFLGIEMVESTDGITVYSVIKDSAADKAGIQAGDIITTFNGKKVSSASDLRSAIAACSVGDSMEIGLTRNGSEKTVTVTMGSTSDNSGEYSSQLQDSSSGSSSSQNGYGYSNSGNSGNGYSIEDMDISDLFNMFMGR